MKNFIIILLTISAFNLTAQDVETETIMGECVQGDCENGVGTFVFEDGYIYDGEWKDGEINGWGVMTMYDDEGNFLGTYDGQFVSGIQEGWGTETWYDPDKGTYTGTHVGNFKNGKENGWGIFIWDEGIMEMGIWENGELK